MSCRLVAFWLACCAVPGAASAHAPPLANGIQWLATDDGERALVRSNRGLILEQPGDGSFRIICNDAFEASLAEVPPVAVTADGRLLLGTYTQGLVLSSPDRCSFDAVGGPFTDLYPIDLQTGPEGGLYAAVLPRDGSSAQLQQSSDEGQTADSLALLPGAPSALEISASDASRLYVSTTIAEGNLSFGRLLTSRDAGRNFDETEVELDASELRVFLLAVDPNDPDRLFLRSQSRDGLSPERLLRSDDGGSTFDTVLSAPGPLTATVQFDGTVWAGSAEGLYRSDDGGRSFSPIEGVDLTRVSCLEAHAERLYACAYSEGEFGVVVSADAASSFQWFLRFPWVTARLDCPADSDEGMLCALPFLDWTEEQGLESSPAGGEAGAPPEAPRSPPRRSESGCQLTGRGPGSSCFVALSIALGLGLGRRRRRRF